MELFGKLLPQLCLEHFIRINLLAVDLRTRYLEGLFEYSLVLIHIAPYIMVLLKKCHIQLLDDRLCFRTALISHCEIQIKQKLIYDKCTN